MKHLYWLLSAGLLATPAMAQTTSPAQPPAGSVPAAPAGAWTLQRAVDYALQNNLNVRQTQLSADLNEATLRQSRAALLPTAGANASQSWNFGTSLDPLTNEFITQTIRSNNFSLSSQVTLFSGFQLRNTIKQNALTLEAGRQDVDKARNDLALNVASQYLQLVLAEELVRANQVRVNSAEQQIERTRKLLRAGAVAESNLLDAQAQQASDQTNVITAENQRDIARLQLIQLMNLSGAEAENFQIDVPQLPDPDDEAELTLNLDETYRTAESTLPEVKAADQRVRASNLGVDVARGAYYPRLTFSAGIFTGYSSARSSFIPTGEVDYNYAPVFIYDPTVPGSVPVPTQFVTGVAQPRFDVKPTAFSNQIKDNLGKQLQFNLNVPILNGFQARINMQRAQVSVQQAQLRADQTRLTLRQNIQQAYADARAAQRRYVAAKRQVEALTTAYRNAEIRFNNGLLNGTEFNISKNNLTAAESSMIQAKYEFIFRRKVLDFYQGGPISL
ncbi:TolC family protein [Hymenobacter guriensis]|uniref:TolC family protein n=1 Tax=Hymenobacter guriensis TaxID=2793065 RepID=A0ABS0L3P9_9BACT|nr:TolC family protein [Hymenobacter guriensis]MBG8554765.1 TolC family protein [Hymenobacter guriensis]